VHQATVPFVVRVSHRQYQVLQELAYDGPDDETIARRLGVSIDTVRTHLKVAYKKVHEVTGMSGRLPIALMIDRGQLILKAGGPGSKEQLAA
jgi:DNA-binding NarL/FixJ family response regulator